MKLTIYQVDAFAEKIFTGNPAAVVPLEDWIEDGLMQKIAMENNLSETAFFVKGKLPKTEADKNENSSKSKPLQLSEAHPPERPLIIFAGSLLNMKLICADMQLSLPPTSSKILLK